MLFEGRKKLPGWLNGVCWMGIWYVKVVSECYFGLQNGQNFPISDQHKNHWNHLFYLGDYYTQKRNHSFDASGYMKQSVESNMYFKKDFVNNQCFHLFHLQVCFLVVPCPSIPAPQTSETDYGDDYGDYDASVKVLKDVHIDIFNYHCWLLLIFFSSPCRVQQVVQATDLRTF